MFEVTFLIPTYSNEGEAFDAPTFTSFEAKAVSLFGGLSRLEGLARGQWMDAGRLYEDASRVYVVAVASITDGAKVAELVSFVKETFRQEAVFLRYLGVAEIL
jgi:hypothetical protein